jgi:predicted Zn-dependent protease
MRNNIFSICCVALVASACEEPAAPVRPEPYEFRLFKSDTVFHWPSAGMPVQFYAEPVGRLPIDVDQAILQWQRQFLYGEFSAIRVEDSVKADVLVYIDGSAPPNAPPTDDPPRPVCSGVTELPAREADAQGRTRLVDRLRIRLSWFFAEEPSDVTNCLSRVTTHELGHALGLVGHSPDPADLMYAQPSVTTPSFRDQATIQTLYHLPTDILPFEPNPGLADAPNP